MRMLIIFSFLFLLSRSLTAQEKLSFWINAFIPRDVKGVQLLTGPVPDAGSYAIPFLGHKYLTDNRLFSSDLSSSSRIQSLVVIDLKSKSLASNKKTVGETIELSDNNIRTCVKTASESSIRVNNFKITEEASKDIYTFTMLAGAKNPCVSLAPEINWEVLVTVNVMKNTGEVLLILDGKYDPFPAIEMYAKVDNLPTKTLIRSHPNENIDWENIPAVAFVASVPELITAINTYRYITPQAVKVN